MNKSLANLPYHKPDELDQCVSPVPNPVAKFPHIAPQAELILLFASYPRRIFIPPPPPLKSPKRKRRDIFLIPEPVIDCGNLNHEIRNCHSERTGCVAIKILRFLPSILNGK